MNSAPIIIEQTYKASPQKIWKALTDKTEMKDWYFDIKDFKAEPGFQFSFYEPGGENKFHHLCEVKEVIPEKKLSYTWSYEFDPVQTLVSFELFPEADHTRVRLTHEGLDDFDPNNKDLKKENFIAGWTEILGTNLKNYLEK